MNRSAVKVFTKNKFSVSYETSFDTNILLRLVEITQAQHKAVSEALKKLKSQNAEFYILLQNISEFWNVCTRPKDKNGLGLTISETDLQLKRLERFFIFLPDTTEVYKNWRELVVKHSVFGIQVPDEKIAAALDSAQHRKSANLQRQRFQTLLRHQSRRTERRLEF